MLKTLLPSLILAIYPAHINLLDLIILTVISKTVWSSSFSKLLHSPFSFLLGPNIRPRNLFSKTLTLCSSLNRRDDVYYNRQYYCCICFNFVKKKMQRTVNWWWGKIYLVWRISTLLQKHPEYKSYLFIKNKSTKQYINHMCSLLHGSNNNFRRNSPPKARAC